jgi:sRNA-binding carbon storage regulator CsrA
MSNLLLTRKSGQSVKIGDAIMLDVLRVGPAEAILRVNETQRQLRIGDTWRDLGECFVTVVSVSKGYVKLAFDAPRHVAIMRTELCDCNQGRLPCSCNKNGR